MPPPETGRELIVREPRVLPGGHATGVVAHEPDEARELVALGFEELVGGIGGIRSLHQTIAERAFRWTGPGGLPARIVHDRVSAAIYGGLAASTRGIGIAAGAAISRRPRWSGRVVSTTPPGAALVAAVNGLVGDTLERRRSALHEAMAPRVGGRRIPLTPEALAEAYPEAGSRIAIFLHGLMETEFAWQLGARRTGETYGTLLERDLGFTPVYLRYNSGRRISENGRSLAELVEQLVGAWPLPVEQVALVGHSMGGLVARSGAHQAQLAEMDWPRRVRHVVSLGTPHMGAPLEQLVHYASAGLHVVPETRGLSRFLRRRSGGIRDLRQGSLVDEDWRDRDPDALRAEACAEVPLLDCATHCFVTATITRNPRHPLGRLIGDFLVLQASGSGRSRTRRIPFDAAYGHHVGGASHFALLNHPEVYAKLREWLGARAGTRS